MQVQRLSARQRRDNGVSRAGAILASLVALVCIAALGTSFMALVTARGTREDIARVLSERSEAPTIAPQTSEPVQAASTTEPAADPGEVGSGTTSEPPVINPTSDFVIKYTDKQAVLRPNGGCGSSRGLDLDEPKVDPVSGVDARYVPLCSGGSPRLSFQSAKVAVVSSKDAQPNDCVEQIDLAPAAQAMLLNQDLVICAITDGQGRADDASLSKIVRIVVSSVTADKVVTLRLTAWEVPN